MESLADLGEKDRIGLVRISPRDASSSWAPGLPLAEKVAGETLGHFGAFLKRSWRSNDLLWGRLDAVTTLLDVLLVDGAARLAHLAASPQRREAARAELAAITSRPDFSAEATIDALFPRLAGVDAAARNDLVRWLASVLAEPVSGEAPTPSAAPGHVVSLLATAAHLEIIAADFPQVVKDAVDQRYAWASRIGSSHRNAVPEDEVVHAAIEACVDRDLGPVEPSPALPDADVASQTRAALDRFRRTRIGRETPASLPAPVLLDLVGRGTLVAERLVSASLRAGTPGVLRKALTPVSAVFRTAGLFLTLLAHGARVWVVWFALRVASWVLLAVGLLHPALWMSGGTLSLVGVASFLLIPLGFILVDSVLFVGGVVRVVGWGALVLALVAVALLQSRGAYDRLWAGVAALRPGGLFEWLGVLVPLGLLAAFWVSRVLPARLRPPRA
jgi:hypothetical protein